METDLLLVILLILQILIGFIAFYKKNKGLYLQDIRFIFLLVFALYALFWPINCLTQHVPLRKEVFEETLLSYNLAIMAYLFGAFFKGTSWMKKTPIKPETGLFNYFIPMFILVALVGFSIYFMYRIGMQIFSFNGFMSDRLEYFENVNQLWVILKFLITAVLVYLLINYKKIPVFARCLIGITVVLYIIFQLSLGNRNEFVMLLVSFFGFILCVRQKSLNLALSVLFLLAFMSLLMLSVWRNEDYSYMSREEAMSYGLQNNEFVFPMQTTYHIIGDNWSHRYGQTYVLLPIQLLIPKSIYPNKPSDLGSEFVRKTMGAGMGYAYTPVTEAYLNFGIVGPIIVYFIIGLFLDWLVRRTRKNGVDYWYLVFYGLTFNFCRGDFSTTIYSLFVVYLMYNLVKRISVSKIEKKRI